MKKQTFKEKWKNFLDAVFSPVPVVAACGSIILLVLSVQYKDSIQFSILINIIGSLLIGIAGAFIKGRYEELTEESVLVKKGQSAIRNLQSIGQQIAKIRGWTKFFVVRKKDSVNGSLEEIERHLSTTELNIRSGIDDWTDIVPELKEEKERAQAEARKYEEVIHDYQEELLRAKKQLLSSTSKDSAQTKELEVRIKKLEKDVKDLRAEQQAVVNPSNYLTSVSGLGSTSYVVGSSPTLSIFSEKTCSRCGKKYQDTNWPITASLTTNLCDECRSKDGGIISGGL